MKKNIYLLLTLLTTTPSIATENIATTTTILVSTLLVSDKYDKQLSRDFFYAIKEKRYTVAKKLITNPKVDVNVKINSDTPLIWCAKNRDKYLDIVELLLKHSDINVNACDKNSTTPLIWCAKNRDKYLDIVKLLLKHSDINVNACDKNGTTPLIQCCKQGDNSLNIAKCLLDYPGIYVNLQDKNGNTPLDTIKQHSLENNKDYTYANLWKLLIAKGAKLSQPKPISLPVHKQKTHHQPSHHIQPINNKKQPKLTKKQFVHLKARPYPNKRNYYTQACKPVLIKKLKDRQQNIHLNFTFKKLPKQLKLSELQQKIANKLSNQITVLQRESIHHAFIQLWVNKDNKLTRLHDTDERSLQDALKFCSATGVMTILYKFCYYPALFMTTQD